jgi:hypothetical protein
VLVVWSPAGAAGLVALGTTGERGLRDAERMAALGANTCGAPAESGARPDTVPVAEAGREPGARPGSEPGSARIESPWTTVARA